MRPATVLRILAAAASALVVAPPAGAASGQTFSVRPAHHDPADPATRAYFKPVVAAGGTFSDEVVVANTGDQPISFFVSGVDGLTAQTTGAVYANRQDPRGRTGAWVTPAVDAVTVAPRSEASVAFTVRVPADAPPGDHLAGVAFENAAPQSSGTSFQVTEVVRAVVGVSVRVPGPAEFRLRVGDLRLGRMEGHGTATVFLRLANEGRALGKPDLSVTLVGPDGARRSLDRRLDTVLPGDEVDYPLAWPDDVAPGRYEILAVASGPGTRAEARAVVDVTEALPGFKPGSSTLPTAQPADDRGDDGFRLPWWAMVLAVAIALAAGRFIRRPRRIEADRPASPDDRPERVPAEADVVPVGGQLGQPRHDDAFRL